MLVEVVPRVKEWRACEQIVVLRFVVFYNRRCVCVCERVRDAT